MSVRNEYRREEKAEGKAGEEEIVMCPASEVCISTALQKQILRQGFKCKLFIKEVLPGETSKGVGGAEQKKTEEDGALGKILDSAQCQLHHLR